MTLQELVGTPAKTVRYDEELMRLYIERFKAVFGYEPNCAGCTFNTDFNKLKRYAALNADPREISKHSFKTSSMATGKFNLKRQHRNDILSYKDGNRTMRVYGKKMTDEFAEAFLSKGTKAQLAEREKMFESTPKSKKVAKTVSKADEVTATVEKAEEIKVVDAEVVTPKADTLTRKKSGPKKK